MKGCSNNVQLFYPLISNCFHGQNILAVPLNSSFGRNSIPAGFFYLMKQRHWKHKVLGVNPTNRQTAPSLGTRISDYSWDQFCV